MRRPTDTDELQRSLNTAGRRLAVVEETAMELHKCVDVGVDVAEIARLGRLLDAQVTDWMAASSFLEVGEVRNAFATCNGLAFSLAGHAKAAVGFNAMSNRGSWRSRWDNVWSEWQHALLWRNKVLAAAGVQLPYPTAADTERSDPP